MTDVIDLDTFRKLAPDMQQLFKYVMALFGIADGLINANLSDNFIKEVKCQAAQLFYRFQGMIEDVHAETYSLMLHVYIDDEVERRKLLHAVEHFPVIKEKQDWVVKWFDASQHSFAERIVAFAAVECVFFSPSFAIFYYAKWLKILPGLAEANDYIARDEGELRSARGLTQSGTHVQFACSVYKELKYTKLPPARVQEIVREACEIEQRFADFLLMGPSGETIVPQLTAADMKEYVKVCADVLCIMLGVPAIYGAKNPLGYMDMLNVTSKTNFFERWGVAYETGQPPPNVTDQELDC